MLTEDCPICLSPLTDNTFTLPIQEDGSCAHSFHKQCLLKCITSNGLRPNCPVCRVEVSSSCAFGLLPPIVQAIVSKNTTALIREIDVCADIETRVANIPVLVHACRHGFVDGVRLLLAAGANPNAASILLEGEHEVWGCGPLTAAVMAKSKECIDLLVKAGATLDKELSDEELGLSPLVIALEESAHELFYYLLDHCSVGENHLQRAFQIAVQENLRDEVTRLLERGVTIPDECFLFLTSSLNCSMLGFLLKRPQNFETTFSADPAFALAVHRRITPAIHVFLLNMPDWQRAAFTYFGAGGSLAVYREGQQERQTRKRSVQKELSDGMQLLKDECANLKKMFPTWGPQLHCPINVTRARLEAREKAKESIHLEISH